MGYLESRLFVMREEIRKLFSLLTKSRVKFIAESPHKWQKTVFGTHSLYAILCPDRAYKSAKQTFAHFAILGNNFFFLTWHCDVTTIQCMTSQEWKALVLWRHSRHLFFYSDVTGASFGIKSPKTRLFDQRFVWASTKNNPILLYWSL